MNIAFFGRYHTQVVNGVLRSGFFLAHALTRAGVNVFFCYWGAADNMFTDEHGIHHRVFKTTHLPTLPPASFRKYIAANIDDIDAFHFHSVFIPDHYGVARLLHQYAIPYVVTPHGGYNRLSLARTYSTLGLLKKAYANTVEKFVIKHASGWIAVAEPETDDIESMGATGKMRVIHNAVPATPPCSSQLATENVSLLFLGRYNVAFKSLDFLMKTFRFLREAGCAARLVMHGEGKDRQRLLKHIDLRDHDHVHIGQPLFDESKRQVICNSTMYFQPSQSEAFGMSMAEVMGCARPAIITDESYLAPLMAKHGVGLVVPFQPEQAAATIHAYLQKSSLEREGVRCREFVNLHFNPAVIAAQTRAFYEDVLDRSARTPFSNFTARVAN